MKAKKQRKRIKRINKRPYMIFTGPEQVEQSEKYLAALFGQAGFPSWPKGVQAER